MGLTTLCVQPLQERFHKRMTFWKEKDISAAGKEILIKSIAQALPTYVMSVFKLPLTLCDDLMKRIRSYWWGAEQGKRKVQWVPWERMILPKGYGGMGFKDLRLFNQALLARQAWRLIAFPNSFCAQVLRAKYFPQGKLLDTVHAGEASPTWRAIEYGLELLKEGVVHRIGDGRDTRIWRDNWLPMPHNMKPIGSVRTCRLRWVHHLINSESKTWDETLIRRYFHSCDVSEILKIKLPSSGGSDLVAWNYEKTGTFTVRSAYRLAMRMHHGVGEVGTSFLVDSSRQSWKKFWKIKIPSKVKAFAWKFINNGLPTNANKCYRHIQQQT